MRVQFRTVWLLVIAFALGSFALGQESPQAAVASKTAKFETVAKTDDVYKNALGAHDLAGAEKLFSKPGSFKGTVAKVFVPRSGAVVILNFDEDYKKALTAVVNAADFKAFPDLNQLLGKEIVVSGTSTKFNEVLQVELTKPGQISFVK